MDEQCNDTQCSDVKRCGFSFPLLSRKVNVDMGLSSSRKGHDIAPCHAVFRSLEEVVMERSSRVKPADQMEIIQRCQAYDPEVRSGSFLFSAADRARSAAGVASRLSLGRRLAKFSQLRGR